MYEQYIEYLWTSSQILKSIRWIILSFDYIVKLKNLNTTLFCLLEKP